MGMDWVWVAIGGALGSTARVGVTLLVGQRAGTVFPWGTLTVNLTGAFAVGLLITTGTLDGGPVGWKLLGVGLLGAYTTVSAFSVQTNQMLRDDRPGAAATYFVASLLGCPLMAAVGMFAGGLMFW